MATVDKDLEDLMSHLGEFGKYQFRQYCLHLLAALTAGVHMLSLLTVAAVPAHHCDIPKANVSSVLTNELFNLTTHNWANSSDVLEHLPRRLDSCHYLDHDNVTRECNSWTYDTTYFQSSRGMEWNFVCSRRWMGAMAQSSYMFGVFVGAITLGSMADTYGRKIIFYVSAVAQLGLGVLVALVNNYYVFLAIRFLYGIFGSAGAYITAFVLTMELVGPSKRTVCGIMFQLVFAIGFMLVAVWGAVLKDRMWLQIVYGLHSAILLGHWWLMDESPRWLWAHGRAAEAIIIVQKGLKVNGNDVHVDAARLISRSKVQQETKEEKSYSALDLFKTPNLRKKSLNICLNWFANSIAYYGLALNMGNLVGNPFVMLFLSGVLEFPVYILIMFIMDRTGRRCLTSTFLMTGGLCCICAATISGATSDLAAVAKVTVVLVGKSCIAGSFAVIYNYTAELFPTVVRNTAIGIGSMCARFSGALTPMIFLLDSLDARVPATLFGLIALMAGFLALYLPETVNQPMPETIEDGENFGKGDTCFTTCLGGDAKVIASEHDVKMDKIPEKEEKEKLNDI
ncbi:organic cation transporter protein [Monomorium pharaonis]|uniref:organic cation transporter protein n=1 Tax=Monomorium pharaonis TaxID=307658 RepID=UPI00063ED3BD|nr:organic cation transporter protein [Monomorium pharaonis]XP_012524026.1 organic cation transporter protein [Monomorium pharaonis]XP_012524027.1 organic cation transporter protein [Monomorium pharaonis]XP_012524028.1 organic cation transporter protein [Monomorium pharaonis]XP_012524030.1 organic cation transporter protein [Monomorium pharaonis]XP_012524031.1 organic cation transporter protein [Monomorium pharaonis]XP_036143880.1 organic cation transporter protein [Monomorium pharaonis]